MTSSGPQSTLQEVVGGSTSSSSSSGQSLLQRIREEFTKCASPQSGTINAKELARRWLSVAEEEQWVKGFGPINEQDKRVIALRVAQLIHDMGLRRGGRVTLGEWVHHLLLIGSGCTALQVNSVLKVAMRKNPRILEELQQMFVAADTRKTGSLSFKQIVQMYGQKLWHQHAGIDDRLSDADVVAAGDPETFARSIVEAMALNGDECVTYAEFMAHCLGRRKEEVTVHLYDLSNGIAESLSPWVLGAPIEGVWHTGVVAFGREYFFSRDTVYDTPGDTSFGKPCKVFHMGYTLWRQDELHTHIVEDLKAIFHRDTYDVTDCNCNHFSASVLEFLNVAPLPDAVLRQPEFLKSAQWVRSLRPFLNWYMRDGIVARDTSSTGVEKHSEMRRRLSTECPPLQPGAIVKIESQDIGGPVVLGMVCSPEGRPEGHADSRTVNNNTVREGAITTDIFSCGCRCSELAPQIQVESLTCVRYFSLTLANPSARSPGRLVTEMVPRSRVIPAKLDEINGEKLFNTALHSMSNSSSALTPMLAGKNGKVQAQLSLSSSNGQRSDGQLDIVAGKLSEEQVLEELAAAGCEVKQVEAALDAAVELMVDQKRQKNELSGPNVDSIKNMEAVKPTEDATVLSSPTPLRSMTNDSNKSDC